MKIIVVYVGDILHCPPALSLIGVLNDLKIETIICLTDSDNIAIEKRYRNTKYITFEYLNIGYKENISRIKKYFRMHYIRKKYWEIINKYYDDNTILWVLSEVSLKHLGSKVMKFNYILHLLELIEELYYIPKLHFLKMNAEKYAKKANVLVEAEYNRAHITKAWWSLNLLPSIFPNKPYEISNIEKKSEITSSKEIKDIINKIKNKKIILYQGNISTERPLREYIHAVNELGEDYVFVMMINGDNPYPELKFDNFYCLPFVEPPFHLEVTSHSYIGIISYTPIKNDYSILNTLYCAPNKVWEYGKFGVPIIGNDLPSLSQQFNKFHNGICIKDITREEIKKAIMIIENDYDKYSKSAVEFYNSVDLKVVVRNILNKTKSSDRINEQK